MKYVKALLALVVFIVLLVIVGTIGVAAPPESQVVSSPVMLLPSPGQRVPADATLYWSSNSVYPQGSVVATRPDRLYMVAVVGGGAATNGPSSWTRHATADGYTWRPIYSRRSGVFFKNTATSGYTCLSVGYPATTNGGIRLNAGETWMATESDGIKDSAIYGAASVASPVFFQEWGE